MRSRVGLAGVEISGRKSIEIAGVSADRPGLNAANGPLRAALNWPALNELDTADPTITARLRARGMHCAKDERANCTR